MQYLFSLFDYIKNKFYIYVRNKQHFLKLDTNRKHTNTFWMYGVPQLLNINDLQFGDVLFCGSSNNEKNTELIQNTTDGAYIHSAIYIGDNKVVDVITTGIRNICIKDFINNYSYIAVTRCPGNNHSRKNAIMNFINLSMKRKVKYSYYKAILSPIKEYFNIKWFYSCGSRERYIESTLPRKEYFCSEFIVDCYKASGYIRVAKKYMSSDKWTPTGLAEENIFSFIGYLSKNGFESIDHNDTFLGGNVHLLTEIGRKKHEKYLKKFHERFKIHMHTN